MASDKRKRKARRWWEYRLSTPVPGNVRYASLKEAIAYRKAWHRLILVEVREVLPKQVRRGKR